MVGGITIKQSSGGNFFRLQQRACQTHSRTGHWCRLADPRKCWLFILSKSNLLPKQPTRSPLLRSQVGVSLMTLPLVIRCGWWGLISAPISAIKSFPLILLSARNEKPFYRKPLRLRLRHTTFSAVPKLSDWYKEVFHP